MDNEKTSPEIDQENQEPGQDETTAQPGWFQDFVDHYDVDKPQKGEMLKGTILDIQESSILLDVGFKRDAIIPGQDLDRVDPKIRADLAVGAEVYVCVIRTPLGDDDLLVSLLKGLTYETWAKAEQLASKDEVIELEIIDQNRGGLLVELDNLRGFIPNSHIPAIRRGTGAKQAGEIKSALIGKTLPLKLIEVDQKESRLVFSARVAQKGQREKRFNEIEIGSVVKSRVVNIVDFGVFVDLDGIDGLVHKSELDWERIPHPSKIFELGDEIEVQIVGVDKEKERISLSRKILLPNPWLKKTEDFKIGDLVEGLVVSVLDFGAFVELKEGLQGLVHVSEIGYANSEDPKAVVKKGDRVLVKIMGIDKDRQRISLSMRRVPFSEQMEWIMNIDSASENAKIDSVDDPIKKEEETTQDALRSGDVEETVGESDGMDQPSAGELPDIPADDQIVSQDPGDSEAG